VHPAYAVHFKKDFNSPISNFHDILVEECFMGTIRRGIQFTTVDGNVTMRKNHMYHLASSAIFMLGIIKGPLIIDGNHIHHYVVLPDSPGSGNTHMSGISIGNDRKATAERVEIRGNIVHDCGNTGPISMYSCKDGNPGWYTNMLVENNLVYDPHNNYTVRLQCGRGSNFVVRNNTFVGKIYTGKENTYLRYSTLMMGDYPFYNNVVVGSSGGSGAQATGNVVFHSSSLDKTTNKVFYSGTGTIPMVFEQSGAFFVGSNDFTLAANHGLDLTDAFKLAAGSAAIGYGTAGKAPATDILGNTRDAQPDAGCYEYGTTGIDNFQHSTDNIQLPNKNIETLYGMYDLSGKKVQEDKAGSGIYFRVDETGYTISTGLLIK
jgi:hypothetical protein